MSFSHCDMKKNPVTFLSKNVQEVLINLRSLYSCKNAVINENFLIDWNNVNKELKHISDCHCILENSWEWYKDKIKILWGIMQFADEKFRLSSYSDKEKLFTLSSWVFSLSEIKDIYKKFETNRESELLFCILKITSYLDRALGDVYTSSCDNVPFLLRDMLASSILSDVFGKTQIKFLQLLLGTVRGINLRNIAWHGFFSPGELHPSIVSTIFLVIASLGASITSFLRKPTIKCETIKNYTQCLEHFFSKMTFDNVTFMNAVMICPFIPKSYWDYWKYACDLYIKGCYGDSLIFLMPLKESILRSIFCHANDCSERVLTAEATTFYTTMDDVLAPNIESGENRLEQIIGSKMLEMLLDLYIYEEGPRLRDRISHSEIKPYDILDDITRYVFEISMLLIIIVTINEKKEMAENETLLDLEYCSKLMRINSKYEPQFHPTSIFKRSLIDIISKVAFWNKLPTPPELGYLIENENKVVDLFKLMTGHNDFLNFSYDITARIIKLHPATIYRPKHELELISMLRKIVSSLEIVSANIVESCETRYLLWGKKQMKSRNRENYKRLLDCMSTLQLGIGCLFQSMFKTLKQLNHYEREEMRRNQRFFRMCQKYAENASTMSSTKKNRWKELKDSTFHICSVIVSDPLFKNE